MSKSAIIQTWSYLQYLWLESVAAAPRLVFPQLWHLSSHRHAASSGVNPQLCPGCAFQSLSSPPLRSHSPVLLSGFLYRCPRSVEGRGQSAEEPSQQGEAQASPGTEHGPAIAVTDVLWQPVDVARVAWQLKIDPSYARAERDDATGTCRRKPRGFYSALRLITLIVSGFFFFHLFSSPPPAQVFQKLHIFKNTSYTFSLPAHLF